MEIYYQTDLRYAYPIRSRFSIPYCGPLAHINISFYNEPFITATCPNKMKNPFDTLNINYMIVTLGLAKFLKFPPGCTIPVILNQLENSLRSVDNDVVY